MHPLLEMIQNFGRFPMAATDISTSATPVPIASGKKLRLGSLTALVIGSMVGPAFSLPQNMAASAVSAPYYRLGHHCSRHADPGFRVPDPGQPQAGSGCGSTPTPRPVSATTSASAWGYWISAWLGNVGYFVLLFSTLLFFPDLRRRQHVAAIIGASVLLWGVHFLVLRGIKGGIHQPGDHGSQGRAVAAVCVDRNFRLQTGNLHRRHLGPEKPGPGQRDEPGAQHDAGHRLGVHRHRGREHLFSPGGKTQRRG